MSNCEAMRIKIPASERLAPREGRFYTEEIVR
jgi:hypothetical protein